jgi:hypothetical protein
MGNIFNEDFQDFIQALHLFEVEYVLVGGYSVILHGYSRTTGDMEIWVNKTETNYRKIQKAFLHFGMGMFDMTLENFLYNENFDVFTFGRPPVSIDIMTSVKGLKFEDTFREAIITEVEGTTLRLIHYNHLILAKKASNRPKDQDDLENLKSK